MKRVLTGLILTAVIGCGGSGGSATAPTPSVSAPSISTTNAMVFIGQRITFSASGGGTIRWGGDNSAVATIDATTGQVTGIATGRVTIWAENAGGRTTRLLRVLPSYSGIWGGNYRVQDCQSNGAFALVQFCGNAFFQGQSLSMGLNMAQTEDRVSGAVALGGLLGTLTATSVAEDGQIRLTGTLDPISGNSIRVSIENMRLESPSPGTISGQYEQVWSDTAVSGTARVYCRVESLTRESGGPSLRLLTPARAMSLEDIVRAVTGR